MRQDFVGLRLIGCEAIDRIFLHRSSRLEDQEPYLKLEIRNWKSDLQSPTSNLEFSIFLALGSRHLLFAADIVLGSGLKLVLAVLAAEVVRRSLIGCPFFRGAVVDFHATHWVDSHI